jgi:epoxyqueuosine reductase
MVASAQLDLAALAAQIRQLAREVGFDLVGICSAAESARRDYFRQWLDQGRHGTMDYLLRRFEERMDPSVYLPGAKSVICVAMNYHVPLEEAPGVDAAEHGRIARYALGDDYHEHFKPRLFQLADLIRQQAPDAETRCCVDTAPVAEKELAARAGIGWVGKHTCIINESAGSWLLLGEVMTTLELPADEPGVDRCGTCRRCIDACPTAAITAPYQLDARRCISYLNIEHRGEIASELQSKLGAWVFGCDICQEVCPWNAKAPTAVDEHMQPRRVTGWFPLEEILSWRSGVPNPALSGSAIKRVKLPILQRNARLVQQYQTAGTDGKEQ